MTKKTFVVILLLQQSIVHALQKQEIAFVHTTSEQREVHDSVGKALDAINFTSSARLGFLNRIKKAIDEGVHIDVVDKDGNTALMLAAGGNEIEIVKYLIDAGADLNKTNVWGMTVLMRAALLSKSEIIEILIGSGADYLIENPKDKNKIAASYAVENEWYDAYRTYLKAVDRGLANRELYLKEQDDARLQIVEAMFEGDIFEISGIVEITLKYLYSPLCPTYEVKK